jgi:hypothetical protein
MSAFSGASPGSLKPKVAVVKTNVPFSFVPTEMLAPTGASLTGLTSMVIVRATASRSRPPLAVPPLSRTWKVKLA